MITKMLVHILAAAAALLVVGEYVPGIEVGGFYTAIIVALLWGLLGLTIRPLLLLLTLPITLLTFGLFSFVLNALLFWFMATFIEGFAVAGFIPALIGSAALTLVSSVLHRVL